MSLRPLFTILAGILWLSPGVLAQVVFEAESFLEQTETAQRSWHITKAGSVPDIRPDADPAHLEGASGGTYIEALPDTRRNHGEKLIRGENFSDEPGKIAILRYKVEFPEAGRYYVWARAFSTGTEDNGFHIGLNGAWPESGRRWQTVIKNRWHWECKQRTKEVHTGVPMQLFLDIPEPGEHEILISMREDGAELDQFLLTRDREFRPPGYHRPEKPAAAAKVDKPAPSIEKGADGDGSVSISGARKLWHKVTVDFQGPWAHERATPNPFLDYDYRVHFEHLETGKKSSVLGYFAADGEAANSSAESGTVWRAHFSPALPGKWKYEIQMSQARGIALGDPGEKVADLLGGKEKSGTIQIAESDKMVPDLRARGRLEYTGERYLRFAGDGSYFLKAGPDAPETFLAYRDFDGTRANSEKGKLKSWGPHQGDWNVGDPSWKDGKGKGIVGAINYLSEKGLNTFSFLTYNAGGDGDNVWPFIDRDEKFRYDCSKLDQWEIVFSHATARGMHLHFKLQETEMDDNRRGHKESKNMKVPTSLDGGRLGPERKLYLRELVARFGHHLALNWNIGEENTQSTEEVREMGNYLRKVDPYGHPIVIHTFPNQQEKVYPPLLGTDSPLTGASLQNPWNVVHQRTLQWIEASEKAGKQWVVANDEQNPADLGVPPDPGFEGHSGTANPKNGKGYDLHDIRRDTLWGNLMAGGAGVEYYFGYKLPENDLYLENFRSREQSWNFCRIAIEIFRSSEVPFWEMKNANALVGNPKNENRKPWCLAKRGENYLVYIPDGFESANLQVEDSGVSFEARIWDPAGKNSEVKKVLQSSDGNEVELPVGWSGAAERVISLRRIRK